MTPAETIKRLEAVRNWHISEERYYAEKNTGITATHTMFIADIESALAALRGLASSASAIETTRCTCTDTTQCEYCRVLDEKNTRMLSAGTVAVPREPTDAMVQAGYAAMRKNASAEQLIGMTCEAEIYRAMLAAAPAAPEAGSEQIAGTTASARPEERPPQWTAVGYVDREGVARWELGRGPADHPHGTLLYVVKRPDMNSGLPKEKP